MKIMISVYRKGDKTIWIPVAKPSEATPPRAFLPINGLTAKYRHGYKARIEESEYFSALASIQQSYINNDYEDFWVEGGEKQERQYKFKWRHRGALIGPTLGWAKINFSDLSTITCEKVAEKAILSGSGVEKMTTKTVKPVFVSSEEELDSCIGELLEKIGSDIPQGQSSPKKIESSVAQYVRDAMVVAYVLKHANGYCECCGTSSPFIKASGQPYLEVHHVKHLSNNGSDKVTNTVALCPNCHRELHYGVNREALVDLLYGKISRLIRE